MNDLNKKVSGFTPVKLALLAQKIRNEVPGIEYSAIEPIAVIGMGCRFPGGAEDAEAFWEIMMAGVDAVRELPASKWNAEEWYSEDRDAPGKISTKFGAFLDDIDLFDAEFFGISPNEAIAMDPQQRLALMTAHQAMENAGLNIPGLIDSDTGVFMGVGQNDYANYQLRSGDPRDVNAYTGTGLLFSAISGRISYAFGFHGPSETIDGACSSSLITIHRACQSLRSGESSLALAGGVHLIASPEIYNWLSRAKAISPGGRCKTFDESADGYSRGEGCGIVVLKRLSDALRDGDNIVALVRGSAENHGGPAQGFTVPNGVAQQTLLRQAIVNSGVEADQITYIEAHGTGTALGDPIEVNALNAVFAEGRNRNNPLWIGSVKTNIGHLETAAGVAGFMKAALALQRKKLPPHLHFKKANPHIDLEAIPARIPVQATEWSPPGGRRLAGVSSFGITGQNAHVILEEAPALPRKPALDRGGPYLLPLSAKSPEALKSAMRDYIAFLQQPETASFSLADICYTASLKRSHYEHRVTVAGADAADLVRKLELNLSGEPAEGIAGPGRIVKGDPQLAFVFSGQGPQWFAMGRQLLEREPVFRATIEAISQHLSKLAQWSLLEELKRDESSTRLSETEIAQPAIFALQMALFELWKSRGVTPQAVVGHSVGEVAAACAAGVLSLEEAATVIFYRARCMQKATGLGKMAAVELPAEKLQPEIKGYEGRLEIGAINGPGSCVLSGDEQALNEVLARLQARSVYVKLLPVNYAFHSPQMEPFKTELAGLISGLNPRPAEIPIYSTVTGKAAAVGDFDARYWGRNIREAVSFSPAIQEMARDGFTIFLELSPHPVLQNYVQNSLEAAGVQGGVAFSLKRNVDESLSMMTALGALHVSGLPALFSHLYPQGGIFVRLPGYPWQLKSYWAQAKKNGKSTTLPAASPGDFYFLGRRIRSPLDVIQFESVFTAEMPYCYKDHVLYGEIVVPGASHLSMALSGAREAFGAQKYTIEDAFFHQALVLPQDEARLVQLLFKPDETGRYAWSVSSLDAADQNGAGEWILHATGKMTISPAESPDETLDAEKLKARFKESCNREQFYQFFLENGYDLRDTFQWVDTLYWNECEALCWHTAPPGVYDSERYILFPSLIDAFFQASTRAYPFGGLAAHTDAEHIYVPWNQARVEFFGNYSGDGSKFWCHLTVHDKPTTAKRGQEVFRGDCKIYDENGRLVAAIKDWALKRINGDALLRSIRKTGDWLYQLNWKPARLNARPRPAEKAARWLIVADRSGVGDELAAALVKQGRAAVVVKAGDSYAQAAESSINVNPLDASDFERAIRESFGDRLPDQIVYLWGADAARATSADADSLDKEQAYITGGLLSLGQAMLKVQWKVLPRLRIVTRGSQSIDGYATQPGGNSLWGMGRVIALENPDVWAGAIDLAPEAVSGEVAELLKELFAENAEDHVALRGAQRLVAELAPFKGKLPDGEISLRKEATYLVTGGLGGVGLEVADWLTERGAGVVALVARSAPGAEAQKRIAAMEARGASVLVFQGDVTRQQDVERIFADLKAQPPLAGVIHSAGVLKDGILTQLAWEDFTRTLDPKVRAVWNLHLATRSLNLDFFALFSSIAALFGSPGQANYAAANGFMDAFAAWRHSQGLPAVSIAWGPWAEVGMAANIKEAAAKRGWRAEGLGAVDLKNGLNVLGQVLRMDAAHIAVAPFRMPRLFEQFPLMAKQTIFAALAKRHAPAAAEKTEDQNEALAKIQNAAEADRRTLLANFVKEQVARTLGFDVTAPIDAEKGFFDLGGDSLTSVQLRNRMQSALGKNLPTTFVFDYPTVRAITEYLAAEVFGWSSAGASAAPSGEDEDELNRKRIAAEVDSLSDEEAEAQLLKELAGIGDDA